MRVHFSASEASGASTSSSASDTAKEAAKGQATRKQLMTRLENEFEASLAREREMRFEIHPEEAKPRTLIMVSKIGRECLPGSCCWSFRFFFLGGGGGALRNAPGMVEGWEAGNDVEGEGRKRRRLR